jgi:hypothetical protein
MSVYSPKLIIFEEFEAFLLGDLESSSSDKNATEQQQSNVAELPVDVPFLPDTYSHRPSVEGRVIDLLLGNVACNGGCIAAHGMGGAGTHLTSNQWVSNVWLVCCFQVRLASLRQWFGRWQYANSSQMV